MKSRLALLLVCAFALFSPRALHAAAQAPVPEIIRQGLASYAQNGLNAALENWFDNSLLDRAVLLRNELAALKTADANYGLFEGGEVVRTTLLAPRVTRVYLVLYYERAPLWARFDLYTTRTGKQVLSELAFSPKAQAILPQDLLDQ